MARTCRNGHPSTATYADQRCGICYRARARRRFEARHAGHHVVATGRLTLDGHPARRCLTCAAARRQRTYRPPAADTVAVLRAVQGDPPPALNVTERRAAIRQLRGALPVPLIAERVGVTERTVWRHLAATRTAVAA